MSIRRTTTTTTDLWSNSERASGSNEDRLTSSVSDYFKDKIINATHNSITSNGLLPSCKSKNIFVNDAFEPTDDYRTTVGIANSNSYVQFSGIVDLKLVPSSVVAIGDIVLPGLNGFGRLGTNEEVVDCVFNHYPFARVLDNMSNNSNNEIIIKCLIR